MRISPVFLPVEILNIQVFGELGVLLDEDAAGLHLVAHEQREHGIAGDGVLDGDLQPRSPFDCRKQCVCVSPLKALELGLVCLQAGGRSPGLGHEWLT